MQAISENKNFCHTTVLDNKGKVMHTISVENSSEEIRDLIEFLGEGEKHAVIEASSTWTYIYDILEELGVDVIIGGVSILKSKKEGKCERKIKTT
ncbi:MAG: hypothetical protein ACE5K0_08480 [Candidatus Methanofastidiosia archaeon]